MHIVVMGAGALGGLVGAQLHIAGEDVTLIEINQARARLISETGLLISEGLKGERCVPIRVVTSADEVEGADLVFVAVKSYQTEEATLTAQTFLKPEAYVLSMQNGIGNTDIMAGIGCVLGQRDLHGGHGVHLELSFGIGQPTQLLAVGFNFESECHRCVHSSGIRRVAERDFKFVLMLGRVFISTAHGQR